jgi:hypothetical protein
MAVMAGPSGGATGGEAGGSATGSALGGVVLAGGATVFDAGVEGSGLASVLRGGSQAARERRSGRTSIGVRMVGTVDEREDKRFAYTCEQAFGWRATASAAERRKTWTLLGRLVYMVGV